MHKKINLSISFFPFLFPPFHSFFSSRSKLGRWGHDGIVGRLPNNLVLDIGTGKRKGEKETEKGGKKMGNQNKDARDERVEKIESRFNI